MFVHAFCLTFTQKICSGINQLINFKPRTILPTSSVFMGLLEAIFVLLEFCQQKSQSNAALNH